MDKKAHVDVYDIEELERGWIKFTSIVQSVIDYYMCKCDQTMNDIDAFSRSSNTLNNQESITEGFNHDTAMYTNHKLLGLFREFNDIQAHLKKLQYENYDLEERGISFLKKIKETLYEYTDIANATYDTGISNKKQLVSIDRMIKNHCIQLLKSTTVFDQHTWKNLTEEDREQAIKKLAIDAGQAMKVNIKGAFFYKGPPDDRGYIHGDGYIYLNKDTLTDERNMEEAVNTVFHEARHAFQKRAIHNPQTYGISQELANEWRENYRNYIDGRKNRKAYLQQPIERDAFAFGDYIASQGLRGGEEDVA